MAFVALNGYDVEHASQMLVYENIFPTIQHINGKGVIDRYTKTSDVEDVTYIDVMRVLPYAPRFRQLGGANNGAYHNVKNEGGYGNAPQSTKYTVPVDLIYDEGVEITSSQDYANPVNLKARVMAEIVLSAGLSINIITFAKQIEAFFRVGDNFHKAMTHTKGNITAGDVTDDEMAAAVYQFDPTAKGLEEYSPASALQEANASLDNGIPEIGAFVIPAEERQAFITPNLNRLIKGQYAQNASEASARILATGFINPFNDQETKRIDSRTGLCGTYDGVDMYLFNAVTRKFVYVALGISGTANDGAGDLPAARAALDNLAGLVVYGAGTLRGIVGPYVEANKNPFHGGVYILPRMKVGVECINGMTIKALVDQGKYHEADEDNNIPAGYAHPWGKSTVIMLMNTLTFTPIDGSVVKGNVAGFNDGTTN